MIPTSGDELARGWVHDLHLLGYRPPTAAVALEAPSVGRVNRDAVVASVLDRLGARRSGWNAGDVRGEVEQIVAMAGVVADGAARRELAEDLTSRALAGCVPLLTREDVPEHVRALTSPRVLAVEADLIRRPCRLGNSGTRPAQPGGAGPQELDPAQRAVATALARGGALTVIEGAAGSGKTTTFAAASARAAHRPRSHNSTPPFATGA